MDEKWYLVGLLSIYLVANEIEFGQVLVSLL